MRDDRFRSRGVVGVFERTNVDAGDPRASNALFVYGERTGFVELKTRHFTRGLRRGEHAHEHVSLEHSSHGEGQRERHGER